MARYEHAVYRVKVLWSGGDYYLGALIEKDDDWPNVDHLGEMGWEFVAFIPDHEIYIKDSFASEELALIRLAVFKRRIPDSEDMGWGVKRPR
jgi:hypothetical protein